MPTPSPSGASTAALRAEIDERLLVRDRPGAVQAAIAAVHEGDLSIDELYTEVLAPLLVDTGARWQRGAERVWEEHFATATVRTIVEALFPDVIATAGTAPSPPRSAVLACPPGEQHDLGLRMLADRMRMAGWDAHFLGADTPVDEIAAAARALEAELVVLSAATHYNLVLLRTVVDRLELDLPGVRVGLGGPALHGVDSWPTAELLTETDLGLDAARPARQAPVDEGEGR